VRFVYYQPLEIDTSVGRYLYPLAEGGTDEKAKTFWLRNDKVEGTFSADIEVKSEWPIDEVRLPGLENESVAQRLGPGHHKITLQRTSASLTKDLVIYYRLADNLPGRVEVVAYRPDPKQPGTFMMVVTPGIDLQPIRNGADFVFALDVSGSMSSKLATLADAVQRTLGELRPGDRFRIVTFSDGARDLTNGFVPASAENVAKWSSNIQSLQTESGTNVYAGLDLALSKLDGDRATSVVLVTDGVTNEGIVDPREFAKLLETRDVRVFGFVMGNSGNWPLMDVIAKASGGFAAGVSNDDDIVGQVLLAKNKIAFEALHDVELSVKGVRITDATDDKIGKIYRGQQLVVFGRYAAGGAAEVTLKAKLTGQDKMYRTTFNFPEVDTDNPEIERLYALARVEAIESRMMAGVLPPTEGRPLIERLGVDYQIVTDETAMVVLADDRFEKHGVERRNKKRTAAEYEAQRRRGTAPIKSYRADTSQPMFSDPAPSVRKGGGAIDPMAAAMVGLLAVAAARAARRPRAA
jgi:Ca-activated chloride channel family protein